MTDYREFMIQKYEKLINKVKELKEQADMVQYDMWMMQNIYAKLEADPEKDKRAEEIIKDAV